MNIETINTCKSCIWAERGLFGGIKKYPRCLHPKSLNSNLRLYIHGTSKISDYKFCSDMRVTKTLCGPDGKFWEQN